MDRRDLRLDLVRGVAIIIIALNHVRLILGLVGYRGPQAPSLSDFGPSSAAELFVGLSGYMVGLVYLNKADINSKLINRIVLLYKMNVFLFFLSFLIVSLGNYSLLTATSFEKHMNFGGYYFLRSLTLTAMPYMLDVLPLYILLMAAVPLAKKLYVYSAYFLLVLSTLLWIGSQFHHRLDEISTVDEILGWGFDPFAWQLLFFGMMILGVKKFHLTLLGWFDGSPSRAAVPLVMFLGWAVAERLPIEFLLRPDLTAKASLGVFRLVHSLLTMAAMFAVMSVFRRWTLTAPARWIAMLGQHSLYCFSVSIPLTYAVGVVGSHFPNVATYALGSLAVLAAVCVTAWWRQGKSISSPAAPLVSAAV